jgi:hypothetical protein
MYTNAQYVNGFDGKPAVINATNASGQFISIPLDPANTDYINIMKLVQEGKLTITPAS